MNTQALEELGLSQGEIKVYLALLKLGDVKVGEVIENSGMASSAVHNSINALVEKGLISYIKRGKIKHYKAINPKHLIDFLEIKKEKLISIIPELESTQKSSDDRQEAEIFEGKKGVISMLNILIENVSKRDKYLYFSLNINQFNEDIQEFFSRYDAKRQEKGIIVQGLASEEVKKHMKIRKNIKMKFTKLPIPEGIAIVDDKVAIFSWGEKPVGYLIESKQISEMYANLFYRILDSK
ncbi:hypothetical protein CMI45_02040 [Candidatus Pacearchaeota archaeon]|nr:hypothetical protein [Candidatus Pacearchaeota archaeon]|tara:strand:+ start:1720 stop:2433 length:714 start_codon:yes stop_codon:yes gene_type:complete